jgi:hypothetical protein
MPTELPEHRQAVEPIRSPARADHDIGLDLERLRDDPLATGDRVHPKAVSDGEQPHEQVVKRGFVAGEKQ